MASEFWFPWYPAHYRRDAGHLDHLSDSCYRRLLDAYMEGGEPIKKDPIRLMTIMRVSAEQFSMVWPQIEGFFDLSPTGFLRHKRCDIELDRQDTSIKKKSIAGQRSAEKRKELKQQYQLLINDRSTRVPTDGNARTPNGMEWNEIEQKEDHKNDLPPSSAIQQAVDLYHEAAERVMELVGHREWQRIQLLTDRRKRSIAARLKDLGGIEGWKAMLEKAEASSFITGRSGRTNGHEHWRPDFDSFFLNPSKITKLMEGTYDDRPKGSGSLPPKSNNGFLAVAAELTAARRDGGPVSE